MKEHQFRLLKASRTYKGKRYDNLYLQIDGGSPVGITIQPFNFKVKNFLLAVATDCEIRQTTIVREVGKTEEKKPTDTCDVID